MQGLKTQSSAQWLRYVMALFSIIMMTGCASSWSAKVTTYQHWPAEL